MRHTIYGHKRALFRLDNQTLLQSFHNNFFLFNPTEINVWLVLTYGPENTVKKFWDIFASSPTALTSVSILFLIFFKMFQNFLTISTPTRGRPSTTSATCSSQKCWCIMPGHARLTEPSLFTKVLINYSHTCCENEQNKSPQRAVKKNKKKTTTVRWTTTHTHTQSTNHLWRCRQNKEKERLIRFNYRSWEEEEEDEEWTMGRAFPVENIINNNI